ncbi:VIT domain-containing protein [Saccharothrix obliqua]|uniref:VIT domain-containing protein n=1 Tax=Saccharothrix obliqua TaxID=2861747 RepID=UPI001C5DDED3|nr:VIT domain-containing protein [Saccharothrix obliqua]MBW4718352.1 VWA domain-containing protein [Saccharothrix obliqua]
MSTPIEVIATAAPVTAAPATDDAGLGCLRTERGNLPLEAVDVRAAITGLAARTTLTQVFRNPHDVPLEATYVFPLPSRSAVTALRMEAAGRVVEGVLKERGEARADYAEAVAAGRRAAIAEEERPGVFTTRVGNVLPGERVTVRLTLAGALAYEDDAAVYRLPLVVAPRYVPGTPLEGDQVGAGVAADTDAVPDASRISPPVLLPGFPNPVRLSVEVDVDQAGLPPVTPSASLHATVTERTATGFRVRVEPGARVDRDFLLRLSFADEGVVRTSLAVCPDEDGRGGTFAVTVLPPKPDQRDRGRDVVLVLDRSGSMQGWKMVAARRAAARIVDSLTTADRFTVLAFDNVVDTPPALPDGLVEATDRNRYRAVEFLSGVDARGGTELLAPLRQAAGLLGGVGERERVLVLVTDGQVGDEDRLLRELADPLAGVRVHTVGIDRAVNEAFLSRLAGSTGRFELVESEDRLDEAMRAIHHRIGSPVRTGLTLTGRGLVVDEESVTPQPVPDLFPGAPVVVTGRYTGEPGELELSDDSGWHELLNPVPSDNPSLPALWARSRVRDLEDRYTVGRGDLSDLEHQIVTTSLTFGVLSRFTAFVAVDPRTATQPGGQTHHVVQPVELPDGWAPAAGAFGAPPNTFAPLSAPPSPAPAAPFAHPRPSRPRSAAPARTPELHRQAEPTSHSAPTQPETLAQFAQRHLDLLRAATPTTTTELLANLATEINRHHPTWAASGEPATHIQTLRDLVTRLTTPTTQPAELLEDAITTLTTLTTTPPTRRKPFWKR